MVTRKEGLEEWPRTVQERIVEDSDEMLGEGMYNLKKSCSGRVAVVMNSRESIEETLKVAKGEA